LRQPAVSRAYIDAARLQAAALRMRTMNRDTRLPTNGLWQRFPPGYTAPASSAVIDGMRNIRLVP